MLQKITEFWPNLVRGYSTDHFPSQDDSDNSGGRDQSEDFDEQELLAENKNLCWTRLFPIEGYETGLCRKFKLGPDLVEECKAVIEM